MRKYWNKIEAWFEEHAPSILDTFNPRASDQALAQLQTTVGFELPKDFVASYKIHDGQDCGAVFNSAIIEPDSEGLSSIQQIMERYQLYQASVVDAERYGVTVSEQAVEAGIKPLYWNDQWLPIMEDGMGNSYCIDMDPTEAGTKGQIIYRNHEGPTYEVVAKSFKAWIRAFIQGNLEE